MLTSGESAVGGTRERSSGTCTLTGSMRESKPSSRSFNTAAATNDFDIEQMPRAAVLIWASGRGGDEAPGTPGMDEAATGDDAIGDPGDVMPLAEVVHEPVDVGACGVADRCRSHPALGHGATCTQQPPPTGGRNEHEVRRRPTPAAAPSTRARFIEQTVVRSCSATGS